VRAGIGARLELFALERYATVHHLVSTSSAIWRRATTPSTCCAPLSRRIDHRRAKLRAMEIIAELEPSRRGVYCGSLGYWSTTGEMDTSIAIRTAVVRDGRIYFSAGGGIVADSDPEQEYRKRSTRSAPSWMPR
jgi:para-aminobenzoate synthetase component 1